ncbi:MAG: shikimate dehydrogenase [Tissierellia bacterium]|nr:shikimate dehydrogenase [Tissierellia bacterium]
MKTNIDGKTKLLGLFADPCTHSNSPLIHNKSFQILGINMVYLAFQVNETNIKEAIDALKTLQMVGANLSMPNKRIAIPYLDRLSPEAELIGAVNTIVNDDGILTGYITDGIGYVKSLEEEGINIRDKKITVVGAGGAGAAICIQSALEGAREIAIFNRTLEKAQSIANKINDSTACKASPYSLKEYEALKREMMDSHIFTNATNIGMGRFENESLIEDDDFFREDLVVVDIIYNPRKTKMLEMAEKKGCKIINGMGMLIHQAAEAFRLWTGENMPIEYIKDIFNKEDIKG